MPVVGCCKGDDVVEFLYFLESLRMPGLNEIMLLITKLGEETAFLAAALIVFWCVNKNLGYYLMSVGFIGTMGNQFLKLWFRVPRPWVLDPNFSILEQAREAAAGYSFPSGHSQTAVGTFGSLAAGVNQKWIKGICMAVCVLVPLSRMYIGVHTPADVLVGSGMALVLVLALKKPVLKNADKAMIPILAVMLFMAIGLLLFVEKYPFPSDVDIHNLESGVKNAYTMLGSIAGVAVVYVWDRKKADFETKAVWWAQLLKIVLGLALVLGVKEGLRAPLDALFTGHMAARALRYFLIVVAAGGLWPMTFRWFSGLGVKK